MVRAIEGKPMGNGLQYVEYSGLSTDSKPTEGLVTGSVFIEVDTGDVYLFDEVGVTWNKVGGSNE